MGLDLSITRDLSCLLQISLEIQRISRNLNPPIFNTFVLKIVKSPKICVTHWSRKFKGFQAIFPRSRESRSQLMFQLFLQEIARFIRNLKYLIFNTFVLKIDNFRSTQYKLFLKEIAIRWVESNLFDNQCLNISDPHFFRFRQKSPEIQNRQILTLLC